MPPQYARWLQTVTLECIPSQFLAPVDQFRKAGWNQLIYDSASLNPGASVAVFGAFKGDSVSEWLRGGRGIQVFAYEPVPEYFQELQARLTGQSVYLYNFGISERDEIRDFRVNDVYTTGDAWRTKHLATRESGDIIKVNFKSVDHMLLSWPPFMEVLEVNIEGGEYELFELFASKDVFRRVGQVFVQFHDVGPSTPAQIRKTRDYLARTHQRVWCFDMVWEMWQRI